MYDPLVVDTFLQVHNEIAPERLPAAVEAPLRAITYASTSPAPSQTSSAPLEEIAASTEEMLALFHLASGLSARMNVQDAADVITKHLRRLIPCSLSIFFVYRVESDELVAAHAVGEDASLVIGLTIGLGERLSGWVAANRRAMRNSDPVLDLGELARSLSQRPRSCLSIPLLSDGTLVGVLSLYSPTRNAYTEEHQRILEVVSRQVSTIIRQANEFDTARWTLRDRLTGLPNLEHLRQLSESGRSSDLLNEPMSVVLIEVMNLSGFTQRYDRNTADTALTSLVAAMRRTLRAADILFKHGDHGFIALLLHTKVETAELIARRILDAISAERTDVAWTDLQISVAFASAPDDGSSIDDLINRAHLKLVTSGSSSNSQRHRTDSIH